MLTISQFCYELMIKILDESQFLMGQTNKKTQSIRQRKKERRKRKKERKKGRKKERKKERNKIK